MKQIFFRLKPFTYHTYHKKLFHLNHAKKNKASNSFNLFNVNIFIKKMKILRLYLLNSFKHFKLKNSVFRLYFLLKLSYLY